MGPLEMSVHLTTRSCGLFGGGASSNQSVLLEYRWETALEPQHLQQNFTTEHEQEWAQLNHICSAKQTALISRVRLVVDAAHARSCHPNSKNTTDNLLATTWDDTTWNGVTNTTRLFIGDSRMSGEARIYAHQLQRRCVAHHGTFHRSTDYHMGARTSNFAVWCESINAWALYVRSNRLGENWLAIDAASRGLLASVSTPSSKSEPHMAGHATSFDTSRTHVEVIFGTYVWDVIDRDGKDVSVFMHQNIDESQLAIFYAQMQAAMPNAWFVPRGAPPVNPLPVNPLHDTFTNSHVEGKLDRNLPLIRDVHDTWVAQEQAFAARNGIDFLNAFQVSIARRHGVLNLPCAAHNLAEISALCPHCICLAHHRVSRGTKCGPRPRVRRSPHSVQGHVAPMRPPRAGDIR